VVRLTLASLAARRRRVLSVGVAVLIGVAFLTGTLVLGDTLNRNFDRLFTSAAAHTDVIVRASSAVAKGNARDEGRALVDEALVSTVRSVPGVARADAQVFGYGALFGRDHTAIGGNGPPRQAGSWVTVPTLNPYHIVQGRAPHGSDEVVINRGAAKAGDLHVGDTTVVETPDPVTVKIVGIATFGTADGIGQSTFTAFTLPSAQAHVTKAPGEVSSILVQSKPGTSSSSLRARIGARLPAGVEAIRGTQLTQERINNIDKTFLNALRTVLVVFAVIALLVAALTINNTFSIVVAQRTGELALLRAVGASRRQLRRSVTLEAILIGLVAGGLGCVAGLGLAEVLKGLFDSLGFALPAGGLDVRASSLLIAIAVGVVVTVLAAQVPARRAGATPPVAALRAISVEPRRLPPRRVGAGVVMAIIGLGAAVGATRGGGSPALALLASVLLLVAALVLAPLMIGPASRVLGSGLRRLRGAPGLLAEENTRRNPRRSATTATGLVVGVTVVALITVLAASFKATVEHNSRAPFHAALAVNTSSFGGSQLSPLLVNDLRSLPQVDHVVAVGSGSVLLNHKTTTVTNADPSTVQQAVTVHTTGGVLRAVDGPSIGISRTTASNHNWHLGTALPVMYPDGTTTHLRVRAVYDDNSILGGAFLPASLWSAHAIQPTDKSVFVTLHRGVTLSAARHAIKPIAKRYGGDLQDRAQYSAAAASGLNLFLGLVYALLALAIVIALLGIANSLALAVYERRREIALLRAVGETRRQARSALRLESVIIAAFGTLLGVTVGGFLGWSLFEATAEQGATFQLPAIQLVVILVIGAIAGVLAAWRPGRQAARIPILDALATT
jgi:putative ABC transport system permease protein